MSHRKLNQTNHQFHKLSAYSRLNFIKTGLLIACLSLCFIYDRTYFFYPPSLAPTWNDIWVDSIGLLAGLELLSIGAFDIHIDFLAKLGVGVSVAFLTLLLVAELLHVFGIGYFRFHPVIVFEIYTIFNLMQLAYEYQPNS